MTYTPGEAIRLRIEELLREREEKTKSAEEMILPIQVGTEPIIWKEIVEDSSGYFLMLVLLAAGAIC